MTAAIIMLRNTDNTWGTIAKFFHWTLAILIFLQLALGKYAEALDLSPHKLDMFAWHKSVGVSILLLVVLRIAWRLANRPPSPPAGLSKYETRLAQIGHLLLYGLILAVPVSGWIASDTTRVPFKAFFVIPMPDLLEADRSLQDTAASIHEGLIVALLAVVLLHVAAALRHHLLLRNDVLRSMLPGNRTK